MTNTISSEQAIRALKAGMAKAIELQEPSCLAIVDAGANLLGFLRTDGATVGTVDIAVNKAYTAAALRVQTADLAKVTQPGADLYGLEKSGSRPFVVFGGGLPALRKGQHIGAVGVSGGPVETDILIAQAMLNALECS